MENLDYKRGYADGYSKAEVAYYEKTEEDREICYEMGVAFGYNRALQDVYAKFDEAIKSEPRQTYYWTDFLTKLRNIVCGLEKEEWLL